MFTGLDYMHILGAKVEAKMTVFGYARVSSQDQDLAAQDAELRNAGAAKVYREKVSGAKTNRAELMKVVNKLEPGDVLMSPGSTGWRARPGTCSTCSTPSTSAAPASAASGTPGPTPRTPMGA